MGQPNHLQGRVVQHAGEVRLGQPNKIWPNAETHRAQLTGGGSLVPPRQARRARTYLYTRLRDHLHEPLSLKRTCSHFCVCPVGPTSRRNQHPTGLHPGPYGWVSSRMQAVGFDISCQLVGFFFSKSPNFFTQSHPCNKHDYQRKFSNNEVYTVPLG